MINKKFNIISENRGSKLILAKSFNKSKIKYNYRLKSGDKKSKTIIVNDFIPIKGWKAIGNQLDDKLRMSGFEIIEIENEIIKNKTDDSNLTLF